jgi:hypothetical protein
MFPVGDSRGSPAQGHGERLYGLDLWYAAIKAGWTCPPELLQLDLGWQAGARAHLAERQARRTR